MSIFEKVHSLIISSKPGIDNNLFRRKQQKISENHSWPETFFLNFLPKHAARARAGLSHPSASINRRVTRVAPPMVQVNSVMSKSSVSM